LWVYSIIAIELTYILKQLAGVGSGAIAYFWGNLPENRKNTPNGLEPAPNPRVKSEVFKITTFLLSRDAIGIRPQL
jgi:hypothetical protein